MSPIELYNVLRAQAMAQTRLRYRQEQERYILDETTRIPSYLVIRTKYIDDAILALTGSGLPNQLETVLGNGYRISQVIAVGSGLDARPWRMDLVEGIQWFEVDSSNMVDSKRKILRECRAALTSKVPFSHTKEH